MATNQQQQNKKEQEKNSSVLFQKIDLLSPSNKEDISTTEAKSNMSSTKNTKDNRQVVVATYTNYSLFQIPNGLDLEDKSVVEEWWVKYNILHIKYVNGKVKEIDPTWDARESDFKRADEFRISSADDECYEYHEEEEEEEEEDEKYICKICCDYDKEEVGIATGENGVEIIVCKSCDVDGDNYNGWGDKEESESEEEEDEDEDEEEEEEEKYECADCKKKYDNGELFVWDIENGNEENAEELMEDCELRTDYKRCEGCYDNFSGKVIEFLEKKEKNMEEEEEEEDENEKKNVWVNEVNELCVRFGVQNTLSYYEGVLEEKEKEEEIFNCDECNINLLRDKNGILKCVRMYEDIYYCKECYFKLYEEDH